MPGPTSEISTVTIRFAAGAAVEVTAQRLHYYEAEDGVLRSIPFEAASDSELA